MTPSEGTSDVEFKHALNYLACEKRGIAVLRAHYTKKNGEDVCTVCGEPPARCFGWHSPEEITGQKPKQKTLAFQGVLFKEEAETMFDPSL